MELNKDTSKDELFVCACSSVEHQVITWYDDDSQMAFSSIHLYRFPFWKRLWHGIKYILGYQCKYGHFEEFIWRKEDAGKLEDLARRLRGEDRKL